MPLIKNTSNFIGNAWKGGLKVGTAAGLLQGIPAAMGLHPFFSRVGGALATAAIFKNPSDAVERKVILVEGMKEGIYQLLAGD